VNSIQSGKQRWIKYQFGLGAKQRLVKELPEREFDLDVV
jgi:hypothetical protein